MKRRSPSKQYSLSEPIITPSVNDRIYQHFETVQGPDKVKRTIAAALQGDPLPQMLLFNAMVDTWPDLGQALNQVTDEASKAPLTVQPYCLDGEEPTEMAQEKAKLISSLKTLMRPNLNGREEGWTGTIKGLALGYYYGLTVREIHWQTVSSSSGPYMIPIATSEASPSHYRYPGTGSDEERLQFSRGGRTSGRSNLEDFHHTNFLVGENRWHRGGILTTAPLRALVGYWLAHTYGLKWLMSYTQTYGVPFRMGSYPEGDTDSKIALSDALENLGSSGYAAAPSGTKIDVISDASSAASLPQKALIDMANNAVAKFILGQTLTSDVGDSGSRALGDVHNSVRKERIDSTVQFVSNIINSQLIPAVIGEVYNDKSELPYIVAEWPDHEDNLTKVERDAKLFGIMGLPVSKKYLYERHSVPMPDESDEVYQNTNSPTPINGAAIDQNDSDGALSANASQRGQSLGFKADKVKAAATLNTSTLEELQKNIADEIPSITREYLEPVNELFSELIEKALSGEFSDAEFGLVLEEAADIIPDLDLNTKVLEDALANAIGTAMLAGAGQKAADLGKIES